MIFLLCSGLIECWSFFCNVLDVWLKDLWSSLCWSWHMFAEMKVANGVSSCRKFSARMIVAEWSFLRLLHEIAWNHLSKISLWPLKFPLVALWPKQLKKINQFDPSSFLFISNWNFIWWIWTCLIIWRVLVVKFYSYLWCFYFIFENFSEFKLSCSYFTIKLVH